MINKEMETRDADLGYMKAYYIPTIHEFLTNGGILSEEQNLVIKETHEK